MQKVKTKERFVKVRNGCLRLILSQEKVYLSNKKRKNMNYITLNNGVEMPQLGYGVYQVTPEDCEHCVLDAIQTGYRLIDTAQAYHNEEGVGNAIRQCGIPRKELFIVTKVWISNAGEEKAYASIQESLRKLQTEYVDLLLIHQPFGDYYGTYRAMERAYREGKVRSIGVSNFYPDRLIDLWEHVEVKPAVNQVETHVFNQQRQAQAYMQKYGCQIMSWGPLAEGKNDFFHNLTMSEIGKAHGKSVAQVALRYLLQRGVVIIPKSTHKERMEENFAIFDFELTPEEMHQIETLDTGKSLWFSHYNPVWVEQFMQWEKAM